MTVKQGGAGMFQGLADHIVAEIRAKDAEIERLKRELEETRINLALVKTGHPTLPARETPEVTRLQQQNANQALLIRTLRQQVSDCEKSLCIYDQAGVSEYWLLYATDEPPAVHKHTEECWEPDSGCDMGRNEQYVMKASEEAVMQSALLKSGKRLSQPPSAFQEKLPPGQHHLACLTMVTGGLDGPCDCGAVPAQTPVVGCSEMHDFGGNTACPACGWKLK